MSQTAGKKKTISWRNVLDRMLFRPKTRFELKRGLIEKGCREDVADSLLDEYQELGLIDDKYYAVLYIYTKKYCGLRRLRDELRYRGVSGEDIESALEEVGIDEEQRAIEYAMSICRIEGMTRDKLIGRLERRGFAYQSISSVMTQLKYEGIKL